MRLYWWILITILLTGIVAGHTLDEYPDVFLNGKFNGYIVTGEAASGSDVLGAIGISTRLQSYLTQTQYEQMVALIQQEATLQQRFQGDTVRIGAGSDLLEIGENIGEVKETITEFDVAALRGGIISTGRGATDYNQYIRFEDTGIAGGTIKFDRDEDDEVGDFLFFKDGDVMFEYEIEFEQGLETDIVAGGDLEDLENEQISLMGWPYTFVDTDVNTVNKRIRLRMLGGAETDILMEGLEKTYTINNKPYRVEVVIVCDQCANGEGTVKFRVNGETTDELQDGETDLLSDGTLIGVKDILPNEAGELFGFEPTTVEEAEGAEWLGGDIVEFILGATRIEFIDHYEDSIFESGVEVFGENIEDAKVSVMGAAQGDEFELQTIKYRLAADSPKGDVYVKAGHGLRDYLDEPAGLLVPNWDIRYEGLDEVAISIIEFDARGDDSYNLRFTNNQGVDYEMPLVDNSGSFKLGNDDDDLLFIECANSGTFCINQNDYVVLTDDNDKTGVTNVVQFNGVSASQKSITFRDLGIGNRDAQYTGTEGVNAQGNLVVGGSTYTFFVGGAPNYDISMDFTNNGNVNGEEANIVTQGGGVIDLGTTNTPAGTFGVTLTTENSQFDENGPNNAGGDEVLTFNIEKRSGNEVGIGFPAQPYLDFISLKGVNLDQALTPYGVFLETDIDSDDASDLMIEYPREQRGAQVYVTFGPIEYVGETAVIPAFTAIETGTAVLDTEIFDMPTPNMIVIGGPCANSVAAKLLDYPEPCTAGFEPGVGSIRGFNLGDKYAILVAGYDAMDTRKAAAVLAEFEKYPQLGGNKVEVTGTLLNPIVRKIS